MILKWNNQYKVQTLIESLFKKPVQKTLLGQLKKSEYDGIWDNIRELLLIFLDVIMI